MSYTTAQKLQVKFNVLKSVLIFVLLFLSLMRMVWIQVRTANTSSAYISSIFLAPNPQQPPLCTDFFKLAMQSDHITKRFFFVSEFANHAFLCYYSKIKSVVFISKLNQWFFFTTIFLLSILARLLTQSWLCGLAVSVVLLSRGSLIARLDEWDFQFIYTILLSLWFCALSLYSRRHNFRVMLNTIPGILTVLNPYFFILMSYPLWLRSKTILQDIVWLISTFVLLWPSKVLIMNYYWPEMSKQLERVNNLHSLHLMSLREFNFDLHLLVCFVVVLWLGWLAGLQKSHVLRLLTRAVTFFFLGLFALAFVLDSADKTLFPAFLSLDFTRLSLFILEPIVLAFGVIGVYNFLFKLLQKFLHYGKKFRHLSQ